MNPAKFIEILYTYTVHIHVHCSPEPMNNATFDLPPSAHEFGDWIRDDLGPTHASNLGLTHASNLGLSQVSNLGLSQASSSDSRPTANHSNDSNTTTSGPVLLGGNVGVPQSLATETTVDINSGSRAMDSSSNEQTATTSDSVKDLPLPLLSAVKTEREDEVMDARSVDGSPPIAPPTSTSQGDDDDDDGNIATAMIDIEDIKDESQEAWLRRSSRKSRRVRHFSADSEAQLSDIEIRRKRKATSSGASQLSRIPGKRRRASVIETSRGEGAHHGSSAKRACHREGIVAVDLQPLELGAKFKRDMETLNREEKAVVSSYSRMQGW